MRHFVGLCTLALSLCLSTALTAAPTLLGPTGLLVTPTAETLEEDGFNAGIFHIEHGDDIDYTLNYGVRPNLEVGFTRLPSKQTTINAKYAFQTEATNKYGVALGVIDATDEVSTTLYAVVSSKFSPGDLYGVDNFRANLGIAGGGDSLNGLFGGLSFDVAQRVTLMLEHDGDSFNIGARGDIGHGFSGQLGIVGDGHDFTLGVSYDGLF